MQRARNVRARTEELMTKWILAALLALAFGAAVYNQQKRGDDCHASGGHVVETGTFTWECRR